jgi:purine nucleosidase
MIRIVLDTDLGMGEPGSEIDDGFALALAIADPDIKLELVTTVNGNTDVETATLLSLELLDRIGSSDIPVVKGAAAKLTRPDMARIAPKEIAEKYGHRKPSPGFAAAAIVDLVMKNPGEITVVAIGPTTNIAAALSLEPRFATNVKELVMMGGSYLEHVTWGSGAEFNVRTDPEAAFAVLHSGAKQRWVGLDVTLKVHLTLEHAKQMKKSKGKFSSFAGEFTEQWIERLKRELPGVHSKESKVDSCAMHDPLAVAIVTHPEFVKWKPAFVSVITGEGEGAGINVTDLLAAKGHHGFEQRKPNCEIAVSVDAEKFLDFFLNKVTKL